jgi:phosphate transport system permease protein
MPQSSAGSSGLSGRKLPQWSFIAVAIVVAAIVLLLFAVTPLQGRVDYFVVLVPAYVVVQAVISGVVEGRRSAKDRFATLLVGVAFIIAVIPLVGVLGYTIARGLKRFDVTFLTHSMRNVAEQDAGGGAYHAIVGTIEQVGIATVIAVPIGLLVAIYLVEYSRGRLGAFVSFFVDVMTGLPSIVAGLFIYALWILALHQGYSGFAGSLALVLLMLPTIVRSAEEMLKLVPNGLREASFALGVSKWRTTLRIVLPTALPGIITGIMLAIARVIGETAPLLLTVAFASSINNNPFSGAQEGLPLYVFSESMLPNDTAIDRAWAGALTLIIIVMLLNIVARIIARFTRARG